MSLGLLGREEMGWILSDGRLGAKAQTYRNAQRM